MRASPCRMRTGMRHCGSCAHGLREYSQYPHVSNHSTPCEYSQCPTVGAEPTACAATRPPPSGSAGKPCTDGLPCGLPAHRADCDRIMRRSPSAAPPLGRQLRSHAQRAPAVPCIAILWVRPILHPDRYAIIMVRPARAYLARPESPHAAKPHPLKDGRLRPPPVPENAGGHQWRGVAAFPIWVRQTVRFRPAVP